MRRRNTEREEAPPAVVIEPNAIYRPQLLATMLGITVGGLRDEWKAGRLRMVKRLGFCFILGRDVLAWLDAGERKYDEPDPDRIRRPQPNPHKHQRNGAASS
jgi:hypothetical protein